MIRLIHALLIMLITAAIMVIIYFCMSPIFWVLHQLMPSDVLFLTPFLESQLFFTWDNLWIWFVLFVVIYTIILGFVQIFLKEQRQGYY